MPEAAQESPSSAERQRAKPAGGPRHLATMPLLEFLSPPPGWKVERALCASYSAQCSVLAPMLLAMLGQAGANGRGSSVALARALKGLRGKVHFLVQDG